MKKPTVLSIEDNDQNQYLATFLLEQRGYQVVPAANGSRGIELAESLLPDLILLDIQLPCMDGHDVARTLRTIDPLRDVPIVAVTSHAMVGDREKALAAGCSAYIEKPIDPESFVSELQTHGLPPSQISPCPAS